MKSCEVSSKTSKNNEKTTATPHKVVSGKKVDQTNDSVTPKAESVTNKETQNKMNNRATQHLDNVYHDNGSQKSTHAKRRTNKTTP